MYGNGEENVGGANGGENETTRYQGIGAAAAKRQAYQGDFGKAMGDEAQGWQAHGNQNEAANGLRGAAYGAVPSAASIHAGQVGGQSLDSALTAGAGGRGLGAAAAQMQAATAQRGTLLGGVNQSVVGRAGETLSANGVYSGAGGTMRAGDYAQQGMAQQRAEANAHAANTQADLNQQSQLHYEQMGVRNNQAQSENELRMKGVMGKENNTRDAAHDQEQSRLGKWVKGGVQLAGTALSFFSDERTKDEARPMMLSDDRTKLAAAWQEGHKAAVSDVQTLRMKSPAELKAAGEHGNTLANAVRGAKGDGYDEGQGRGGHIMNVPPELQHPAATPPEPASTHAHEHVASSGKYEREAPHQPGWREHIEGHVLGPSPAAADGWTGEQDATSDPSLIPVKPAPSPGIMSSIGDYARRMRTMVPSDKRSKQDAHEEGEMGRALEHGLKPFEYEYKPGFAEHEHQEQGEKNIGPMAQNMASNPITGSAVKKGPGGLLMIDMHKATKLNSAGIGYLAAKQREMQEQLDRKGDR